MSLQALTLLTLFGVGLFYRYIRRSVPFSGTLSTELVVTIYSLLVWIEFGELRARELILIKAFAVSFFYLIHPKKSDILKKIIKVFCWFKIKKILAYLFIIIFIIIMSVNGYANGSSLENIFIAIYVISAPIQGYLISWVLDDVYPKKNISFMPILLVTLPALILLSIADYLALERLVLGSYAIGGLYSHFAIFCILMATKTSNFVKIISLLSVIFFLMEIYVGGSRRYMLPLLFLFVSGYFILFNLQKKILILLLSFLCVLSVISYNFLNPFFIPIENDTSALQRGVGYRDAEFSFVFSEMRDGLSLVFGVDLGFQAENITHGSKGSTDVGPRLHNFYLTIILNLGVIGIVTFFYFTLKQLLHLLMYNRYTQSTALISSFFIGWLVSAWFDMPPDGLWPIGVCVYALKISNNYENINTLRKIK
jgi:hypothetical protein